jgi:hypothetical protein
VDEYFSERVGGVVRAHFFYCLVYGFDVLLSFSDHVLARCAVSRLHPGTSSVSHFNLVVLFFLVLLDSAEAARLDQKHNWNESNDDDEESNSD